MPNDVSLVFKNISDWTTMRCGKSEEFYYKADIACKIIINLAYNDLIFVEKVKLLFFNKYWKIIFAQVIYALTHSLIKKAGA